MKLSLYRFILMVFVAGIQTTSLAQKPAVPENQIKAVFLFNFIQFVEWPAQSFESMESPVVIGIFGKDPFGSYLDEILVGEVINGRPVTVKRFSSLNDIENCQILYIPSPEIENYSKIFDFLSGKNVLTISDSRDFIEEGGIIRFVKVNNKIQFQINPEAAKRANLSISSKLLRLAEIVAVNQNH